MKATLSLLAAVLLASAAHQAAADGVSWHSDAGASELRFAARYEGEEIPGRFSRFEVSLETAEANATPRSLVVEVDVSSADMNDPEINQELAEPDWFDAGNYPIARFESREIVRNDEGYLASGRLRIRNAEREIQVPFSWQGSDRRATLSGSTWLSRLAWQIGGGEWAGEARLDDRVRVSYTVELRRGE